jgi:hypothetical protein
VVVIPKQGRCTLVVALEAVDNLEAEAGAEFGQGDNSLWHHPGGGLGRAAANATDLPGTDSAHKDKHYNEEKIQLPSASVDSSHCTHKDAEVESTMHSGLAFLDLGRANSRMLPYEADRGTELS